MTATGPSATPPPPPRPSYSHRRLLRFPDDGPLGGVCAGVADYLSIDPTIVRIAAVVLAITGPGIPAYLLAWLIVPAADGTVVAPWPHDGHRRDRFSGLMGVVLIFIALFFVVDHWWWEPARGWFVPVSLIAVGAWLLLRHHDEDVPPPPIPPAPPAGPGTPSSPWQATPPTPPTSVVPVPPLPPTGTTEPTSPSDPPAAGTDTPEDSAVPPSDDATVIDEPTTTVFTPGGMAWGPPPPGGDDPTAVAAGPPPYDGRHHRRPRRRRVLGPVVFGVLLLWTGIAWLTGVSFTTGLAVGLCLVGAGFIVGAFTGGSRGLILPALAIGLALMVASTVDIPITSGIGHRPDTVTSLHDLHRKYELGIGEQVLDLRDLALAGQSRRIDVKVGIGHLEVIVPDDISLHVHAKASAGSIDLLGHQDGGTSLDIHRDLVGDSNVGKLDLQLAVGLGRIELRQASPSIDGPKGFKGESTTDPTTAPEPTTPPTPTTPPVPTSV